MKLEAINENYAAVVVKVAAVNELKAGEGGKKDCDNVVGIPVIGFQSVVGKDIQVGDIGIVFPAETQLNGRFAAENNLFRNAENNVDPTKSGYLEDNRRVRAQKFRGHRSDALFMPLSSLAYTGIDVTKLNVGDVFDTVDGHEVCRKYVIKTASGNPARVQEKKVSRVDERVFPQHIDTANFFRVEDSLDPDSYVVVTAKYHGTSIRVGNVPAKRNLKWYERFAKHFGVKVQTHEYAMVYGSRRVIKDINNPDHNHYYDSDIYSYYGSMLDGLVPKNYMIFGELVGWTPSGTAIQQNYTYQLPTGVAALYIYRVAVVNEDGNIADLSWDAVKEFCDNRGLHHVPELWRGRLKDLDVNVWMDKRFKDMGYDTLPLDNANLVDEGIIIRSEGMTPTLTKAKSPVFLRHETKLLDQDVVDLESQS